jgi:hypothetical protein
MTRYAKPDIIACPHCAQKYHRPMLYSFNTNWQVTYSDGSTALGIDNIIVYETRCIQCQRIILDVNHLPALQVKPLKPFWRGWFAKQEEYLSVPHASIDVYFELFDQTNEEKMKLKWAIKAYRRYNQNYLMFGKERIARVEIQHSYREMTDFLLAHPPTPIYEEYNLLCADIYRLRCDFSRAKKIYDNVIDEKFEHVVEQGIRWCDANNASLMAIKEYTQQSQIKEAV